MESEDKKMFQLGKANAKKDTSYLLKVKGSVFFIGKSFMGENFSTKQPEKRVLYQILDMNTRKVWEFWSSTAWKLDQVVEVTIELRGFSVSEAHI